MVNYPKLIDYLEKSQNFFEIESLRPSSKYAPIWMLQYFVWPLSLILSVLREKLNNVIFWDSSVVHLCKNCKCSKVYVSFGLKLKSSQDNSPKFILMCLWDPAASSAKSYIHSKQGSLCEKMARREANFLKNQDLRWQIRHFRITFVAIK